MIRQIQHNIVDNINYNMIFRVRNTFYFYLQYNIQEYGIACFPKISDMIICIAPTVISQIF